MPPAQWEEQNNEQHSLHFNGAEGEVLGPQLQLLLNSAEDFLFVINSACVYTEAFGRGMIRLGLSSVDFIGKTPIEVFGEETGRQLSSFYKQAVKGQTVSYEWSGKTENGFLFFQSNLSPIFDKNNQVTGAVGMVRDITGMKKLEQELRTSEERLRYALEGAQAGVWDWDMIDDELYFSKRWKTMLGYGGHELPNKFETWERLLHPEEKERVVQAVNEFIGSGKTSFEMEYRMRHKDGSCRWILTKGNLQRNLTGTPVRWAGSNIDITSRKQTEQKLAESEQLFRQMFERHPSLKLLVDPTTGRIAEANPAAVNFYGYTAEDLKSMTLQQLGQSSTILNETGNSDTRYIVMRHRLANGEIRDVEARICRITFRSKELIYAILHDISDREKARKWLSDNLRFMETLLDTIPLPVFYKDKNGRYRGCNKTFAEMIYGTSKENVLGKTLFAFPETLTKEQAEHMDAKDKQLLADGGIQTYESSIDCADGVLRDFILSKAVFYDHSDLTAGLVGIMIDITERKKAEEALKESEEKFRSLAEGINEVFWLRTHEKMLYINPAYERVWGKSRQSLYENSDSFIASIYEEDRERIIRQFQSKRFLEKGEFDEVYRIIRGDGEIRWIWAKTFFVSKEGDEVKTGGIAEDVTDLRKTERALRASNATKDKFFSIIAHDLKNPFQSLISLSNMMSSKYSEMSQDRQLFYINEIRKTSQHSYQLLENLLQWSRAQTNRLEISPAPMDMATVVMEISFLVKTQADNKGIAIHSDVEPGLIAFADHNMIRTVLRNLVTNAIKFSEEGSTISISAHKNGSEIITSVSDEGLGIKPEKIPLLFRIDEAVSTPGTQEERGTGLGLILCYEFLKKNSGSISVESQPGKGSTFSFSLPEAAG